MADSDDNGAVSQRLDPPISREKQLPAPLPDAFGSGDEPAREESDRGKPRPRDDRKESEGDSSDQTEDKKDGKKKEQDKPPPKPLHKRPVLMTVLIVGGLAAIIGGIVFWLYSRNYETTDDAFIDGHIIAISPRVSAQVRSVLIDDNWPVKAGQPLVQLDPTDYAVVVDQMTAAVAAADGRVSQADAALQVSRAQAAQSRADLTVAKANAENALRDFERYNRLPDGARSRLQLDNVTAAQKSTAAQVEAADAKVKAADAQVADAETQIVTARADLKRANADLEQAKVNLSYCTITAPQDGRITRKNVEPGACVSVGQVLFSIVPADVWVTANYKETQLDHMHPGQPVTIKVDAFPGHEFTGKIDSIQSGTGSRFSLMPPENATGNYVKVVQRVPVKILFDEGQITPTGPLLAPGMSVDPKVRVR